MKNMLKTMKISLTILLIFISTGCSKIRTATCEMIQSSGTKMHLEMAAKDDEINTIKMTMTFPSKMFGEDIDLSSLTEDQKTDIKNNMLKTLGLDGNYEGVAINIAINEAMVVVIDINIAKADAEVLEKLSLDFEDDDMNLDNAIIDMEKSGATCKIMA